MIKLLFPELMIPISCLLPFFINFQILTGGCKYKHVSLNVVKFDNNSIWKASTFPELDLHYLHIFIAFSRAYIIGLSCLMTSEENILYKNYL